MTTQNDGLRWIEAAENDLKVAQSLLEAGYYHASAFHAQQTAEKALKGLLRLLGRIPWGHNCFDLLTQIKDLLPAATIHPTLFSSTQRLDGHYIPSRYPDAFPSGVPADYYDESLAQEAVNDAKAIVKFVEVNNL